MLALSDCSRIADKSIQSILQLNPEQEATTKKGLARFASPTAILALQPILQVQFRTALNFRALHEARQIRKSFILFVSDCRVINGPIEKQQYPIVQVQGLVQVQRCVQESG